MPAEVLTPNDAVRRAVRRAVIEVHALRRAAQPLTHACKIPAESEVDFSDMKFSTKKRNTLVIVSSEQDKIREILDSVEKDYNSGEEVVASSTVQGSTGTTVDVNEREVVRDSDEIILRDSSVPENIEEPELELISDDTWLAVSLGDPTVKFAVRESDLS